jgi:uroporphyrinogen decarboxylase
MGLTAKERVLAQIHHQETDHLPYTIRFEGDVEARLDAHYGSDAWRRLVDNAIVRIRGPNLLMSDLPPTRSYRDPYGTVWRTDLRPYHMVEPALPAASLAGYRFPPLDAIFEPDWQQRARRELAAARDHFTVAVFGAGIWERAWALRGFAELLLDVAAEPDFAEELIEQVTEHQMQIVERLLALPFDGILFMDDWGHQRGLLLGARRWRKLLKPRWARAYAQVHQAGKYVLHHCCGSIAEIMDDLIEIGVDVLESVQPEAEGMNPYKLKRRFGQGITFWGGLGSQSLIPFGRPEEIRAEVERLCREMGRGGGYILSPAKPLQPETPVENAAAVVEAFLQQAGVRLAAALPQQG